MSFAVVYAAQARKDLRALDRTVAQRVIQAIRRYAETSAGDVKQLGGSDRELRLRVGDWRVRFTLDQGQGIMHIVAIAHRREVYRQR